MRRRVDQHSLGKLLTMSAVAPSNPSFSHVGVVGVGRMGAAILRRLAQLGWEVTGHDHDHAEAAVTEAAGGTWQPSLATLMSAVDVVLTVLPDGASTRATMTDQTLGSSGDAATR